MTSELGLTIASKLADYTLGAASSTYFANVYKGEPEALMPTDKPLARWHVLRSQPPPEGVRNLKGDRMSTVVFGIHCYWPLTPNKEARGNSEDDIAQVLLELPNEFIALTAADYTVGGYAVAALTVEDITPIERTAPFPASERECRILTFELHARVLEAS